MYDCVIRTSLLTCAYAGGTGNSELPTTIQVSTFIVTTNERELRSTIYWRRRNFIRTLWPVSVATGSQDLNDLVPMIGDRLNVCKLLVEAREVQFFTCLWIILWDLLKFMHQVCLIPCYVWRCLCLTTGDCERNKEGETCSQRQNSKSPLTAKVFLTQELPMPCVMV